jgi:hypothetical protein
MMRVKSLAFDNVGVHYNSTKAEKVGLISQIKKQAL